MVSHTNSVTPYFIQICNFLTKSTNIDLNELCDALRDLVTFLQSKEPQTSELLKLTLIQGCFSRFLNCTNDNKSRKVSQ